MSMSKAMLHSVMICGVLSLAASACGDAPIRHQQATASSTSPFSKDEDALGSKGTAGTDGGNTKNNSESGNSSSSDPGTSDMNNDTKPNQDPVVVTSPSPSPVTPPKVPETPKPEPVPEPTVDTVCYKADAFICEIEKVIVEETNKHRTTALVHNKESSWVSRQWSDAQAASGQISHDGFPAARKAALTAEFPTAKWNFYAENVAMNQSSGSDATKIGKAFVDMWWNSAGHKANMLGNYKSIGVGVSKKGNSYYATQIFY